MKLCWDGVVSGEWKSVVVRNAHILYEFFCTSFWISSNDLDANNLFLSITLTATISEFAVLLAIFTLDSNYSSAGK
jgi:hypothetical protein